MGGFFGLTKESGLAGDLTSLLIGERTLVRLVGGESDGHLGDDTSQNGTQSLVQTQGGLPAHNLGTSGHKTTGLGLFNREKKGG